MPHSIKIRGIAPAGLSSYPEAARLQFWTFAASAALKVKDRELAEGLDAHGDPLKPILPITRNHRRSAMTPDGRGDPAAPPLMPARQKSRVRSLLAARAFGTHAELYWRYDPFTGASFDEVLNYQRAKGRDVFGISADGLAAIRKESHRLWSDYLKGKPTIEATGRALPAAALAAGPQARIARIVAASAEPNAGAAAQQLAGVGNLGTRWITRGIEAPVVKAMQASATRTGGMPGPDWRRFWTTEIPAAGTGGTMAGTPPRPRTPRPQIAAMKPARPKTAKAKAKPTPAQPPAPGPHGPPVADGLDVRATGKVGAQAARAIELIGRVHGDGSLPKIPLKASASATTNGRYVGMGPGKADSIEVSSKGDWPALTAIHEIGHFLDYCGIPMPQKLGSGVMAVRDFAGDPRLAAWVKAVESSAAFRALKAVSRKSTAQLDGKSVAVDLHHTAYLLRWREIWARAYAQYIADRTRDAELLAQLDKRRDPSTAYQRIYNTQWEDADFAAIAAAMDDVFKGLGWIR